MQHSKHTYSHPHTLPQWYYNASASDATTHTVTRNTAYLSNSKDMRFSSKSAWQTEGMDTYVIASCKIFANVEYVVAGIICACTVRSVWMQIITTCADTTTRTRACHGFTSDTDTAQTACTQNIIHHKSHSYRIHTTTQHPQLIIYNISSTTYHLQLIIHNTQHCHRIHTTHTSPKTRDAQYAKPIQPREYT